MKTENFLQDMYEAAVDQVANQKEADCEIPESITRFLDFVVSKSEESKAVITVLLTSAVYKCLHPEQDIRRHQSSIENGYSGRTFDTHYITPFLKQHKFPSMAESGWLTRSLEQKVPYDENYTGAIKPAALKTAFLESIKAVETSGCEKGIVNYLLQSLIIQRDRKQISLATPQRLTIDSIIHLLDDHFHIQYHSYGASRLPVLALYAMYEVLVHSGLKRYEDKVLLPLESHTSADLRSGRRGDIDVNNSDGTSFEAIEVKFDIEVTHEIVMTAIEKIHSSKLERYYILSTFPIAESDKGQVTKDIAQLANTHGCQLIVNGVLPTIKYYLRLLDNPKCFVEHYARLLASDTTIKFEHRVMWNNLVANM